MVHTNKSGIETNNLHEVGSYTDECQIERTLIGIYGIKSALCWSNPREWYRTGGAHLSRGRGVCICVWTLALVTTACMGVKVIGHSSVFLVYNNFTKFSSTVNCYNVIKTMYIVPMHVKIFIYE